MTSRDFCYWLQGYFELLSHDDPNTVDYLDHKQVDTMRKHLSMVFKHEIDPSFGDEQHQATLSSLHHKPRINC